MAATVHEELPVAVNISFVENNDELWGLHDFVRERRDSGDAGRKAESFWIMLALRSTPLLI
jgi:hypothetical protein